MEEFDINLILSMECIKQKELDPYYTRLYINTMIRASLEVKNMCGIYAEIAQFHGKIGRMLYDYTIKRKFNFGVELVCCDDLCEYIVMTTKKKTQVITQIGASMDSNVNGLKVNGWPTSEKAMPPAGFSFDMEKYIHAKATINFITV